MTKSNFWLTFIKANQRSMRFVFNVRAKYLSDDAVLAHTAYFRNCNRQLFADLYRFYHQSHSIS